MRVFPVKAAFDAFGISAIDTTDLQQMQAKWDSLYLGSPAWRGPDGKFFNIPSLVTSKISRLAVSEAIISTGNDIAQTLCNGIISEKLQPSAELALASGNCVLRPWIDSAKRPHLDIYRASEFVPTAFMDSLVISGIFVDYKVERDSSGIIKRTFTKLEYQTYDPVSRTVLVSVKAFVKDSEISPDDIGRETALSNIPEWATITPEFTIANMDGPLFVYVKTPWLPKGTTSTAFGASIFADACDQIKTVNEVLNDIDWEFRSGKRKMVVDEATIPVDENGNPIYSRSESEIFRKVSGSGAAENSVKDLYGDYTPTLRINELVTNLREQLSLVSLSCHLDSDYLLPDKNGHAVTATEVIASKSEAYSTVCQVQSRMALPAIQHLLLSFSDILTASGAPSFSHEEVAKVAVAWNDGILNDPQTEHDNAVTEVAQGLMSKKWFLTHIRGLSEDEADAELAQIKEETPVAQSPFSSFGG